MGGKKRKSVGSESGRKRSKNNYEPLATAIADCMSSYLKLSWKPCAKTAKDLGNLFPPKYVLSDYFTAYFIKQARWREIASPNLVRDYLNSCFKFHGFNELSEKSWPQSFTEWKNVSTNSKIKQKEIASTFTKSLPPYCCVILTRKEDDLIFVERRGEDAKVATGKLTCFGGKREKGEKPFDCILRECQEEMSWKPEDVKRCADLYVDHMLVAWFFLSEGPPNTETLTFEKGRRGEWVSIGDSNISPWHKIVLKKWKEGKKIAHFISPMPRKSTEKN